MLTAWFGEGMRPGLLGFAKYVSWARNLMLLTFFLRICVDVMQNWSI
ncbi:hypothetical protein N879_12875 [Alcaligenes sp. EGD-AK7]|nr:hypothetical protein N879_12875 [Alcaligenes sp. EGD-AK7]